MSDTPAKKMPTLDGMVGCIKLPNGMSGDQYVRQLRGDTTIEIEELQRQNTALKAFARTIINENCFGCDGEVDGMSAQDQAEKCGLIVPSTVTREMIDGWENNDSYPEGDFEVGDTIYNFSDWMKLEDAECQTTN